MKKVNINKLLRNIFLVLAIILLCLKIIGRVSAEEMSNDDISYIESMILECDNYDTLSPYMEFIYANFPYYKIIHSEYYDIVLFVSDAGISSRHFNVDTSNIIPDLNFYYVYGFRGSTDRMYLTSYATNYTMAGSVINSYSDNANNLHIAEVQLVIQHYDDVNETYTASLGCYGLYDDDLSSQTFSATLINFETGDVASNSSLFHYNYFSSSTCRQNWVTSSTNNTYQNPFQTRGHNANQEIIFTGSYAYLNEDNMQVLTNHTTWLPSGNSLLSSDVFGWIEPNIVYPDDSNTYGFNCYTEGSYGINYLICDFSELVSISPAVGNSSTLSIKVVADDISEMHVNLDSSSDYYQYSVLDHRARYVIPFSYFGDLENYFDVYLTDIQVVNTTSSPGGSYSNTFKYFTPYIYLKKDYSYESDEIPKYDYTPEISDDDIDDLNDYIDHAVMGLNDGEDKNGLVFPASVFNFQYYQLPSWCNVTHIDLYGVFETGQEKYYSNYWREYNPNVEGQGYPFDDEIDLYRELMGNNYGQYYDVVIVQISYVYAYWNGSYFVYDPYDNPKRVMYGLFYTQRYYDHLAGIQNNDIIELLRGISDRNYKTYEYLKDRLDKFSDNFSGYAKDNNGLLFQIKQSLDGISNKIIGNVNNINIDTDYDLNALGDELKTLFVPSLTWESIDFNDYLDSMGVLALPFEFTNDILTTARSNYSSTLDLHINDFSVPLGSDVGSFTVFEDQDYSFNPLSIFPRNGWELLQYLNAFAVIIGESWFTYCHIFRRSKNDS